MRKTYYHCDIDTCKFKTDKKNEIYPSRILGREYDLCIECRKSLEQFIHKRLGKGHTPTEGKKSSPWKDQGPSQWPFTIPPQDQWVPNQSPEDIQITWTSTPNQPPVTVTGMFIGSSEDEASLQKALEEAMCKTTQPAPDGVNFDV